MPKGVGYGNMDYSKPKMDYGKKVPTAKKTKYEAPIAGLKALVKR
jgi:hypothetical protein